ncbi:uncharacterized protein LOC118241384 isoform X2 [Electrophorus electricus]|uniref:uncharacterized protein LOC118241384 isoform X2 n=1 Tax=Electrophorus electricus TaxID=8005 RepID=UPI0015CF92F8|nr:uncharacterized protein LOC118241384 isoform X2 [Electrophorus electricus]
MAEPGVDVTMWCQHNLHGHAFIFWIKQTSNSVPQSVACKNRNSNNCYFFTPNNRTVMSVNDKNASLTITAVDPTDSGLYYCSLLLNDKITFSNTTYLHVKGDCVGLFTLTVAFGAAIVFLLSSLLIIYNKQKNRKDMKDGNLDILRTKQDQQHDLVNYITHKTHTSGTHREEVHTHVIYYSTRLTVA